MQPYQTLNAEARLDRIGIITLNRPEKRNALSSVMRRELSACLATWTDDATVGAVIITGAGSAFCAGFDLEDFNDPAGFEELFQSSACFHRDLWHFAKPIIAAINGLALGGGFDLAVLCDLRLGSGQASFGHPEIKFGAPPLYSPLAAIIGGGRARDLCLTGRRIDASEALQLGLLSEVVTGDDQLARAIALATAILAAPAATLMFAKQMMNASSGRDFESSFAVEHDQAFRQILLPLMTDRAKGRPL